MRHQVLPLPTGKFIIAACDHAGGALVMISGAPVAYTGAAQLSTAGHYTWKGRDLPATLFHTYGAAYAHVLTLDNARPVTSERFFADELSRPLNY